MALLAAAYCDSIVSGAAEPGSLAAVISVLRRYQDIAAMSVGHCM